MIYGYAIGGSFISVHETQIVGPKEYGIHVRTGSHILSLTMMSRQTYLESASPLFSCNIFGFKKRSNITALNSFVNALATHQRNAIKTLRL